MIPIVGFNLISAVQSSQRGFSSHADAEVEHTQCCGRDQGCRSHKWHFLATRYCLVLDEMHPIAGTTAMVDRIKKSNIVST